MDGALTQRQCHPIVILVSIKFESNPLIRAGASRSVRRVAIGTVVAWLVVAALGWSGGYASQPPVPLAILGLMLFVMVPPVATASRLMQRGNRGWPSAVAMSGVWVLVITGTAVATHVI